MPILEIILLAVSLCADCFAVMLCSGIGLKKLSWKNLILAAVVVSVIQTMLLFSGWLLGNLFYGIVHTISDIIGFLLLLYVGGSMIVDGYKGCQGGCRIDGLKNIIIAGIATSLDALAVGVSQSMGGLPSREMNYLAMSVFIFTSLFVIVGVLLGRALSHVRGRKIYRISEFAGGLVLIGIGLSLFF